MINCTLTPDQIRVFRVKVAGDLLDIINDPNGSFTLDGYIRSVYDFVNKATNDKNLATEYAKIAPIMLGQLMIKPDILSIRKKGLSGDAVLDLIERYSDPDKGLDYTVEDLGLNEPEPDIDEAITELNLQAQREALTNKIAGMQISSRPRPDNPFATTINTLKNVEDSSEGEEPKLAYYTDFVKIILAGGLGTAPGSSGIPYKNVDGGIHLTLMNIKTIPEGQRYSQPTNTNDYAFVITDVNGKILTFNDKYEVKDAGRVIYFGSRPIPQKLDNGQYNWAKAPYTQSPSEISENSKGEITEQDAAKYLTKLYNGLEKSYNYIKNNPGSTITYQITGGSTGTNVSIKSRIVKVADANFANRPVQLQRVKNKSGVIEQRLLVAGSSQSVLVYAQPISADHASRIADLLINDVYDAKGELIKDKYQYFRYVFPDSADLTVFTDKVSNEIIVRYKGNPIDLKAPGAKAQLIEAFTTFSEGDKKGKRLYQISDFIVNGTKNTVAKDFTLEEVGDKLVLTSQTKTGLDYLNDIATLSGNFDVNNKLAEYNSYFTVSPLKADIGKTILRNPTPTVKAKKDDLVSVLKSGTTVTGTISIPAGAQSRREFTATNGTVYSFYNKGAENITPEDLSKEATLKLVDKVVDNGKEFFDVVQVFVGNKYVGNVAETDFKATPKSASESTQPAVSTAAPVVSNPVTQVASEEVVAKAKAAVPGRRSSADNNVIGNAIKNGKLDEVIRKAKGLNKLDKQQSVKATVAQIYAAKAWYEGSPLAKVIPYQVMFNAVNSDTRGSIANWTLAGITLFKGSDFTDLYHEAWHGFTQTFMTEAQRTELYNEARKTQGTFKSYMGRTVSFADATLLELEEHLAEDFREFMLGKGKEVKDKPVRNSFFKWLLDLLNKLFGGTTIDDVQLSARDNKVINELYNNLRVGNLAGYTFDQANANFNVLNKTIESTIPDSPFVMNPAISKLLSASVDSLFVEYIDKVNESFGTSVGTTTLIKDKASLSIGYAYVQEEMISRLADLVAQREQLNPVENDTSDIDFAIETLAAGLANFGNPYDLENPIGLVKFHMNNSELMSSTITAIEEEASINDKNVFEKRAGNEVPLANLARPDFLFTVRSLYAYKDGEVQSNILGFYELNDFNKSWNRILNITEGASTDVEVYEALVEAASDYPVIRDFVNKIGSPNVIEEASVNLWTDITKILTMPRQNLRMLDISITNRRDELTNTTTTSLYAVPYEATGEYRKTGRKWDNEFTIAEPGKYISKDIYGNNMLNLRAVYLKYAGAKFKAKDIDEIYDFFKAIGITLEDSGSARKRFVSSGIVDYANATIGYIQAIYNYNNTSSGEKNPIVVYTPSDIFKRHIDNVQVQNRDIRKGLSGGSGVYKALQKFQLKWSDDFSDTTVSNANGENQQERSLRSTMSQQVTKMNAAGNITELTQSGVAAANDLSMSHLDPERNPFAKRSTSIIMESMFDQNGMRRMYRISGTNENTPVSVQVDNMAGFTLKYTNVKGIMKRAGIDSSSADETTKLIGDFLMGVLYGTSEATRHADKATTLLYKLLNGQSHYIDLKKFRERGPRGKAEFADRLIKYMSAEYERIQKLNDGDPAGTAIVGKETYKSRGTKYVVFDSIIEDEKLLKTNIEGVKTAEQFQAYYENNAAEKDALQQAIIKYLDKQRQANYKRLEETGLFNNKELVDFLLQSIVEKPADPNIKQTSVIAALTPTAKMDLIGNLVEAYTANDWIHKFEFTTLFYGDPALYKDRDDFFKRNAGIAATGDFARTGPAMAEYINRKFATSSYAASRGKVRKPFTNTMNSAVMQDVESKSIYYDDYLKIALQREKARLKSLNASKETIAKAEQKIKTIFKAYEEMKEADGQGWISFDAYRALLLSMNKWTPNQEFLYNKIVKGEEVSTDQVLNFFPVKKMQYWGPLQGEGLPVMGFHKFSLMPLIPTTIKGTPLEILHNKMVDQNIDYALMQSGSKINTITSNGTVDKFYNDKTRSVDGYAFNDPDYKFTPNTIFLDYFKDQLEVADYYKGENTFSSQLRKLIEQGLFENEVPVDYKPEITDKQQRIRSWQRESDKLSTPFAKAASKFENILEGLVQIEKDKIRKQVGSSKASLIEFIKRELSGPGKKLAQHELEFLGVDSQDNLLRDLDLSPSADVIERALVGIAQKKILNQKLTGESLVQVSGVGFEQGKLRAATEQEIARYGTNGLSFYKPKLDKDGNVVSVSAMKIKISLQGPFKKLLDLPVVIQYATDNNISRLDALNTLIKDETELDRNNLRSYITTAAVRIPVQGLNSMEVMEVFEFLPEESGNIIVLPAEIVAKSGGDFDIDKMFTFFPNIKSRKVLNRQAYDQLSKEVGFVVGPKTVRRIEQLRELGEDLDIETLTDEDRELLSLIEQYELTVSSPYLPVDESKAGLENQLLGTIKDILMDPFNFDSLVTPNTTDTLTGLAKVMVDKKGDKTRTAKPAMSEIFEVGGNLYKHQSNNVGKDVLGIIAVVNTFQSIFGRTGVVMEPERVITTTKQGPVMHPQRLLFDKYNKIGNQITLSNLYDADQLNKISDIISQLINGSVDVAKDAWIFDIQGNKELINSMLFMLMAGVPVDTIVYFLSQPIIQDYIREQRKFKSSFARVIKYEDAGNYFRIYARNKILFTGKDKVDKYGFGWTEAQFATSEDNKQGRAEKGPLFAALGQLASGFTFNKASLEARINQKDNFTDFDRAVFAHFLEISEMSSQITQLTQNLNFDRTRTATLLDARLKLAKIDDLTNGISQETITNIVENSPVSAYKVQDFILELFSDLFPLRDNVSVNRYLSDLTRRDQSGLPKIIQLQKNTGLTSGEYIERFRSDMINYVFQSNYFKFDTSSKTYKGYNTEYPIETVSSLVGGARVKEGILYVSKRDIDTTFDQDLYSKEDEMLKRRLAPVPTSVFALYDRETAKALYTKYVYEREVLRSQENNSPENLKESPVYKRYLKDFEGDEFASFKAYESTLRDMALDNLNYHGHVFFGGNSYAKQVKELDIYHKELSSQYEVIDRLELISGSAEIVQGKLKTKVATFNLKFKGDRPTPEELDKYEKELKALADPTVKKVDNQLENARISSLFQRFAVYALLQTGIDTTSAFSLIRAVANDDFYRLLKQPHDTFLQELKSTPTTVLNKYNSLFEQQYKEENRSISNKIKNYASAVVGEEVTEEPYVDTEIRDTAGLLLTKPTNLKYALSKTVTSGTLTFKVIAEVPQKDTEAPVVIDYKVLNKADVQQLAKDYPNVIFVRNETSEKDTNIAGTNVVFREMGNNSLGIRTKKTSRVTPYGKDKLDKKAALTDATLEANMAMIDEDIKALVEKRDAGVPLVFDANGYGQYMIGYNEYLPNEAKAQFPENSKLAEETFLYLSEQLYKNFKFINPHYLKFPRGLVVVQYGQPVTDQEIVEFNRKCFR